MLVPAEAADTPRVRALQAAKRMREAHTALRAARRTARAVSCTRAEDHKPRAERRQVAALRSLEDHQRSAKRWHQTDSCPPVSQSVRDRPKMYQPEEAGRCSTRAPGGEHDPRGRDRAAAKREERRAVLRTAVELLAEARPKRTPEGAVAAEQEGRCEQAEAQLLRPMDCRKTGKTCWWAGSRRRTACTRSCKKLPSSSYGRADLREPCVREHTRFTASLRS